MSPSPLRARSWAEIRAELVRRIPVHAPGWTDQGPGDPGIAILELLASLLEGLHRRIDEVPAAIEEELFQILGLPPLPATPATVWMQARLDRGSQRVVLPYLEGQPSTRVSAGSVDFSLTDEISVLPVEGLCMIKLGHTGEVDESAMEALSQVVGDHLNEADIQAYLYDPVVLMPPEGGRFLQRYDLGETLDGALYVALLAPEALLQRAKDAAERQQLLKALRGEIAGQILNLAILPDDRLPDSQSAVRRADALPPAPVVRYHVSTGAYTDSTDESLDNIEWQSLELESDQTEGLEQAGIVRLRLPTAERMGTWAIVEEGRSLDGVGDLPPPVDDMAVAQRILCWIRAFRVDATPPRLCGALVNVVPAVQAVVREPRVLAHATGDGGLRLQLPAFPVLSGSLRIEVHSEERGVVWTEVSDLSLSGPLDRHYQLDALRGELFFGDGLHGAIPEAGTSIVARRWTVGGGAAGNVGAGSISGQHSGVILHNPLAATGGRDVEAPLDQRRRVAKQLRRQERAVTRQDLEDAALETPGLLLARAHCLPLHVPERPQERVAGAVTVVVLPSVDPENPTAPVPDRSQLARVATWLEPRRTIGCELYVRGPDYVPLNIRVALRLKEGARPATVQAAVGRAITALLNPLPTAEREGWPLGQAVGLELLVAEALRVEGVASVPQLTLLALPGSTAAVTLDSRASEEQLLTLEKWQLPKLVSLTVEVAEQARMAGNPTPAPRGQRLVAVPKRPESC